MEAPEGGSLYTDAYSGRTSLSVSGKSPGSVTVTAVGAGGNYFLFHPLTLLSGGYISDEDYMADRVVIGCADGVQPLRQQRRSRNGGYDQRADFPHRGRRAE